MKTMSELRNMKYKESSVYMSNPDNLFHKVYQRNCNFWFSYMLAFIGSMYIIAITDVRTFMSLLFVVTIGLVGFILFVKVFVLLCIFVGIKGRHFFTDV